MKKLIVAALAAFLMIGCSSTPQEKSASKLVEMQMLKKKYLNAGSKYVPESEQEEIDIMEGDEQERQEAIRKAEEAKKAAAKAKAKKAAAATQYHTIRKGDTLGAIARRYHTTVRNLCRLNGISEKTVLRPGRKLRVR